MGKEQKLNDASSGHFPCHPTRFKFSGYKITFACAVTGTYLYLYFSSLDLDHFPQSLLQYN